MFKLAKISTGLTVFAAAGYLIGAILTDNGSELALQDHSDAKLVKVEPIDDTQTGAVKIDNLITSSIKRVKNINVEPLSEVQKTRERRLKLLRQRVGEKAKEKPVEQASVSGGESVYVVQPGDTLFGIGRKNGLSVPKIAELNGLSDPYRIKPGQKLIVSQ